ncbi:MAG: GNAT family N-acetyltransferase [Anaerolineaceae bacterium]|nr:GNAT family N-acetyltransferase [Anaerolineaceae bacterium]
MRLTIYQDASLFSELQSEWNSLLYRSTHNRIFSTWEWQSTWWEAYHPGDLWAIAIHDENDQLIGIAPWFIEHNQEQGLIVHSIGCVDVSDYLDLIIDRDHVEQVLAALTDHLQAHRDMFDSLDLCNIAEDSETITRLPRLLKQAGFTATYTQQEVCPIINLPGDWEEYVANLGKKYRHELRRKLRRAEGATEKLDWYIVGPEHNLDEELERFLELMAASHQEKAGFLEDEQNVMFFKKISPILFKRGWLQLSFLTVDGTAAAAYLNFDYDNQILVYNSGLLPGAFGHLSPGIVLLGHNIRYAIENRREIFDFLRGNETYKYQMGGQDTRLFKLEAH